MGSSPLDCRKKLNVKKIPLIKFTSEHLFKILKIFCWGIRNILEIPFHGLRRTKNLVIKSPNVVSLDMLRGPRLHGMPHGGNISPTWPFVFERCKLSLNTMHQR